ncbi:Ger(x)C family spore germination protein [Paenibacillus eucommiae]|uniref:Spore germination protein KC n=1 Tax=Paenibacillus eucommiae TaxID=1355755 RepID=A0ABS4ISI1_9BACL|nr:Ger(x)C family spore germination protein [Paenibacillus eucommiae]MBP1989971.1 spore germination protein KC [Paenibacillus eucommiae]
MIARNACCKRITLLCLIFLTLPLVSGCWDRSEVTDMALVMAAGIDQEEHNQVKLSAQIYLPAVGTQSANTQEGKDSNGSNSGQTLVTSAVGISLADAMSHLQERISRRLFWGHNDVYVFGKQRAEAGIADDLDFILRFSSMRERGALYVTEGTASEIMKVVPQMERSSMEALRELSKKQVSTEVDLKQVIEKIVETPEQTFFLPYIVKASDMADKNYIRNTEMPYFHGLTIFKKAKMIGSLDNQLTRGAFWLTNKIKASTINVSHMGSTGTTSIRLANSNTKLEPFITPEGKWKMTVSIKCDGDVIQNTSSLDLMNAEHLQKIEIGSAELIKLRIEGALKKIQKQMKADVFGFGEMFRRKYKEQWKEAKLDWGSKFAEMEVDVQATVYIIRPGTMNETIPNVIRKGN